MNKTGFTDCFVLNANELCNFNTNVMFENNFNRFNVHKPSN